MRLSQNIPALSRSCVTRVVLLATLLILAACSTSQPPVRLTPPASTPTATPAFPQPLTNLLGPAPASCPSGPPLNTLTVTDTFGGGFIGNNVFVGKSPVWNLGLNNGETLPVETQGEGAVTPSPYPSTKVMWIVGPNYPHPVTLSGHELSTGAPVWFDLTAVGSGPGNPMTTAVLDPGHPNRGDTSNTSGLWNIWGILIYFFSAGCYQINVTWTSGSWQMVFAVGR